MQEEEFKILLTRYENGTATADEKAFVESWYLHYRDSEKKAYPLEEKSDNANEIWASLQAVMSERASRSLWPRIAVAASVLLILSVGAYFISHKPTQPEQTAQHQVAIINPGSNQATLTLANGQKIILSKGLSGKLAQQGNTQIHVNDASEIVYSESGKPNVVQYNTLSTAIGEVSPYPLVLADGTKVWLNSKSSITFPTAFTGSKRHVEITGEAYFEVVHHSGKIFTVKAGNQTVEDIGTAFNINSYNDEPAIRTTLVEGSAKVIANGTTKVLIQGQRTLVSAHSILLQTADNEAETAWMNGRFIFHDEELHSAMRQLARWYKIEVIYDYNPTNVVLGGGFSKSRDISKVLKAFEQTGAIKFKIDGHVVHITK
jgi:transmembrane sensor